MDTDALLDKVNRLMTAYQNGDLGGEVMPEDENPHLDPGSMENYLYFTLPMALNYQRNSYVLWECANRMFKNHPEVFNCSAVVEMIEQILRDILVEYKVALQPNKQPVIWKTLCAAIEARMEGDIRNLFRGNGFSVAKIKSHIAGHKKDYPYLGGTKICNYWLHIMERYTDVRFVDQENITVAPDTHVIQASTQLGLISEQEAIGPTVQQITEDRWNALLDGTPLKPIDVHTALWLWSRGKFAIDV